MEIWVDIDGFEGLYQVSNLGRVKNIANGKNKIINGYIDFAGYWRVDLRNKAESKRKNALLHRVIAKAFIPNPKNKKFINHIDGVKTNNSIGNLEWCTHKENMQHARLIGLIVDKKLQPAEKSIAAKLTNEQVAEIKKRIKNGDRNVDIAKDYPVTKSAISEIKAGRSWQTIKI